VVALSPKNPGGNQKCICPSLAVFRTRTLDTTTRFVLMIQLEPHKMTISTMGEAEGISPEQEIDFCTMGMFIIGKTSIFISS
jgi:hypothetical protein